MGANSFWITGRPPRVVAVRNIGPPGNGASAKVIRKSKPPVCFRKRAVRQPRAWGAGALCPKAGSRCSISLAASALRRLVGGRRRRPLLVLGHELVELFL